MSDETILVDKEFGTEDWYRDLVEAHSNKMPDGAITVRRFSEDTGLREDAARAILKERMENEESFKGKKMTQDGAWRWVFWSSEDK